MVVVGLLIGLVGTDVNSGMPRYAFDVPELVDGIGFTVIAVGLFAVAEIVTNLERREPQQVFTGPIVGLMPAGRISRRRYCRAARHGRGRFFGLLPGTGPALAFVRRLHAGEEVARDPALGSGAIEGVAAPEAANNAAAQASFIPTLTLGIPHRRHDPHARRDGDARHPPRAQVMTTNPELFWGIVASMWIGNLMLLVLNLPLVGVWVPLRVPYRWLFPCISHVLRPRQLLGEQ